VLIGVLSYRSGSTIFSWRAWVAIASWLTSWTRWALLARAAKLLRLTLDASIEGRVLAHLGAQVALLTTTFLDSFTRLRVDVLYTLEHQRQREEAGRNGHCRENDSTERDTLH
jgi:hypothetical protein